MPNAQVTLTLQSAVAPQIAQTADAYKALSVAEKAAELAATRYAKALTQVALADAKTATETQRLAVQTANAARAQTQAEGAALRLATAQTRVATGSGFGAQTADAFKSSILGIVGPMAIATGAISLLVSTANSFKAAFVFKAQLDATTASITSQIKTVRDSTRVFAEGQAFADRYKITQADLTSTIQASIGVLRNSRSSTTDLLTTLSLLQATTPDKPISEAARALRELSTGDVTTIKEVFNVGAADALKMKNAIAGGADAVQVLAAYLKDSGASMELLEQRTQGAVGAMNDLAIANEKLALAEGAFAQGPGIALVDFKTNIINEITALLSGDYSAIEARNQARIAGQQAYDAALRQGKTDAEAMVIAQQAMHDAERAVTAALQDAAGASDSAAEAARYYAGNLRALVPAANLAANALRALNAIPPRHIEDTSLQGGAIGSSIGAQIAAGSAARVQALRKADSEAARLQDARDALALSRAKTSAQKIAELRRQQARTTDPVEKLQLQAQIEQERQSSAKSHTSELNKQLKLNESIYDSMAKQRDAALDIEELAIRDRQQDRADSAKIRTANAILSDPRKARLHDAARDSLALIDVQDRKRAAELANKGSTVGAQLINGKLYQSQPGGALPPPPGAPLGALPSPTGAASTAQAGSGVPGVQVFVTLDGAAIAANVTTRLIGGLDRHAAGGGL